MSFNRLPDDPEDEIKQKTHTYTPRSHEELLKKFSRNTIRSEDVKDLKRENDYLKRELHNSKNQLRRLHRRMVELENKKKKQVKGTHSNLPSVPESRSNIQSEIELDTDDDFVKSWEVLGSHFSEVIRRHHEVLAEKDRQIRELQEQQYSREIANRLLNHSSNDQTTAQTRGNTNRGMLEKKTRYGGIRDFSHLEQNNESKTQGRSEAGPSRDYQCEDQCECSAVAIYGEENGTYSGETLSEHFSEVIRRHKQQLFEKDQQILELQDALEHCLDRKPRGKRAEDSEVQMWCHDYHELSQPLVRTQHRAPGTASSTRATESEPTHSDGWDPTSSEEDEDSAMGSIDTFVALEKCQRLESIANLERLRQDLIQRLLTEEKLDKLYWQTELNRYQALREEAGDNFDPESPLNKEFELLQNTRVELLRALQDIKLSAGRGPEMYVKPHFPFEDCASLLKSRVEFPESAVDSRRRVQFTITTVQTKYDSASNGSNSSKAVYL